MIHGVADIAASASRVGSTMAVVSDHDGGIHVAFFLRLDCSADQEHAVVENVECFRTWLESERPAGVQVNVILRLIDYETLLACKSVEILSNPEEAAMQVLGLATHGDWTP